MWVSFWGVDSVPLIYVTAFVPAPYCFDYCTFVMQFETMDLDASSSVLSQDCFRYLWSFVVLYKLQDYLFSKNAIGNLIGIALNLQIALDSIVIFTILILPIQDSGIYLHLQVSSLTSFISVLQFSAYRSFVSLCRFISRYFILFVTMVNGNVSLISLLLLV